MADAERKQGAQPQRLLLHACCGVCALEPTRIMAEEGQDLEVDYTNPNIWPAEEYELRREALQEFVCKPRGIKLHVGDYNPERWEEVAGIYGTDRDKRCRACYRMRFEAVAEHAVAGGFDAISTTLTISPYQNHPVIFEELQRAADACGLTAVCRDWSDSYREATRISRQNGMYRQKYCGCRFSVEEAEESRAQMRELRRARKQEKKARADAERDA